MKLFSDKATLEQTISSCLIHVCWTFCVQNAILSIFCIRGAIMMLCMQYVYYINPN